MMACIRPKYWQSIARAAELDGVFFYAQLARAFERSNELRQLCLMLPCTFSPAPVIFAAIRVIAEQLGNTDIPSIDELDSQGTCALNESELEQLLLQTVEHAKFELQALLNSWRWHAPDTDYLLVLGALLTETSRVFQPPALLEVGACSGLGLIADKLHSKHADIRIRKGCDLHPLCLSDEVNFRIVEHLVWPRGRTHIDLVRKGRRKLTESLICVEQYEGFQWLEKHARPYEEPSIWLALSVFSNLPTREIEPAQSHFLKMAKRKNAFAIIGDSPNNSPNIGRLRLFNTNQIVETEFFFKRGGGEML